MPRFRSAFAPLAVLFLAAATAQDPAHTMIQRAVVAHGGLEKLGRVRADKVTLKGTLHVGGSAVPFTNDLTHSGEYYGNGDLFRQHRANRVILQCRKIASLFASAHHEGRHRLAD